MRRDEYLREDATGLAELIRKGAIAPHEAVEAALARLEEVNPKINAVVLLRAEEALQRLKTQPKSDAPFYGLPYFIKDLHAPVAGLPLAHGSKAFAGSTFNFNAETVERLIRAGFQILGRTNSPELGLNATTEPHFHGPTRNPWSLDHSVGGSSGGAAAAVAAGILPATHATDSGGSIRIPASANGLFGLKPTRGLLAFGPHRGDPNHGFSHEHAVTRTVRDSAAILDMTVGPDVGTPYFTTPPAEAFASAIKRPPRKLKIAIATKSPYSGAEPHAEVAAAVKSTADLLTKLGHDVEEATPDYDGRQLADAMFTILYTSLVGLLDFRAKELGRPLRDDELEPASWAAIAFGKTISGATYSSQFPLINRSVRAIGRFFTRYDILVTPTLTRPPARLGELHTNHTDIATFNDQLFGYAPYTYAFNATGQPAASLPLGWSKSGLPIGVQFVGRFADDTTLLQLSRTLEEAANWPAKRAPI